MAADPSLLGDSSSPTRTATGVAIALLVVATVGAAAMLGPRLRDEFREDIFSAPRPAAAQAPASLPNASWATRPAALPVAPQPVAAAPVPAGSLAPGESEVGTTTAAKAQASAPALKKATRLATRAHHPPRHAQRAERTPPRHEAARPHPRPVPWASLHAPRNWRPGINRDAPSASPTDPQPGA